MTPRPLQALLVGCIFASLLPLPTLRRTPAYAGSAAQPKLFGNACGDGRVDQFIDDFESTSGTFFRSHENLIPMPTVRLVPGCHGWAVAFDYDLTRPTPPLTSTWIVLQRQLPRPWDLRTSTHIRVAIRGSQPNSHEAVEVKLGDGDHHLATVRLPSLTDLPVWRPVYIDLRDMADVGNLRLSDVRSIEVGIVRCVGDGCEVSDSPAAPTQEPIHAGTLYLDEFAAVDLKPGAPNRPTQGGHEAVAANPDVRDAAAAALLAHVTSTGPGAGLVPAWFPEPTPNFNTYAQAEALLVFVSESSRTGDSGFRKAASNLANRLVALQIPPGRTHAGAWHTAYLLDGQGHALIPPHRSKPEGQPVPCDGNEAMYLDPDSGKYTAANIDACEWVGNIGWALISIDAVLRSGLYDDPAALRLALARGAAWIEGQPALRRDTPHPDLISQGMEGNVSAYFGLVSASRPTPAAQLGAAIFATGWNAEQRHMNAGTASDGHATTLDMAGSWGATFLRAIGKPQEALDSQSYAAAVMRANSFDDQVHGYGDIAGPFTVALEFTAQGAAAGIRDADAVMRQIYPLQVRSGSAVGAFPGATDHWYGGQLAPWNTTMTGVSPTAWVYFATTRDPLLVCIEAHGLLPTPTPTATATPTATPTATHKTTYTPTATATASATASATATAPATATALTTPTGDVAPIYLPNLPVAVSRTPVGRHNTAR